MTHKLRLGLITSLASLLLSLLLLEGFLRLFDPTGAYASGHDAAVLRLHAAPHPTRGYVLQSGTYEFRHWTATINEAGQRVLPHTNPADCTVVILGDSWSFGFGVDDDETWADRIAREFPDVYFVNTALNGYNSANIRATAQETSGDGYLYYLYQNDVNAPAVWQPDWATRALPSGLETYIIHGFVKPHLVYPRWPEFEADFQAITQRPILVFAHEEIAVNYSGLVVIPPVSDRISAADRHPDAAGHQAIADSILPYVQEWIVEICPEGEVANE